MCGQFDYVFHIEMTNNYMNILLIKLVLYILVFVILLYVYRLLMQQLFTGFSSSVYL
jgi:hypothetical protein